MAVDYCCSVLLGPPGRQNGLCSGCPQRRQEARMLSFVSHLPGKEGCFWGLSAHPSVCESCQSRAMGRATAHGRKTCAAKEIAWGTDLDSQRLLPDPESPAGPSNEPPHAFAEHLLCIGCRASTGATKEYKPDPAPTAGRSPDVG